MRKFLLPLLFLLAQLGFSQNQVALSPEKAQIFERLQQIENSYISKLDFNERRRAIQLMNEVVSRLQRLNDTSPPVVVITPTPAAQPVPVTPTMSDAAFMDLLDQVKNESFADDKTKLIMASTKHGFISANQLAQLVACYTWDDDKQKLIEGCYKNVYDKASISVVLKYINNSVIKEKLLNFLANYTE